MLKSITPEYMTNLHKFIYLNNSTSTDIEELKKNIKIHLKYIPHKKLYRYRKCNVRELELLASKAIWLADPYSFSDVFDTSIAMPSAEQLDFDFSYNFTLEIACVALEKMNAFGEKIPDENTFLKAVEETRSMYTPEQMKRKLIADFGEEWYEKIHSGDNKFPDLSKYIELAKEYLDKISKSAKDLLAITSFTTNFDNRNMWENYSDQYKGFCIEFDFSKHNTIDVEKYGYDILHLLPVKYYKTPPIFDYKDFLRYIIKIMIKRSDAAMDGEEFLQQYYKSITAKHFDYRAEEEWRLIMPKKYIGKYDFPYISKIIAGKEIAKENLDSLKKISDGLNVPLFKQTVCENCFKYTEQ